MTDVERDLPRRAIAALLWIAAFCFATGIFLSSTLLLRGIPPTAHVAVGRVTIENASKTRDYATAALFFVIVPLATWWLYGYGAKVNESLRASLAWRGNAGPLQNLVSLLFVGPFFLAPFLYLTTFKWGWPLLIPLALSQILPRSVIALQRKRWLRRLFGRDLAPVHALILAEGFAWIMFRYIETARRIAHIPTLFLEVIFVFLFLLLFWVALVLIARLASFTIGGDFEAMLQRVSLAALPMAVLPALAIFFIPGSMAIAAVLLATVIGMAVALNGEDTEPPSRVRAIVAYAVIPLLLYCLTYASMNALTQWIDLFHRGETLGPASDYLRGKVPYRDVFVLHGLLMDGQLDAWLMQLFGRDFSVALARPAILGAFATPALWYLALAIFDSIPLAAVSMFLGALTTLDNERVLFEIAVLALLLAGIRGRMRVVPLFFSGVFAALGLFYSFDMGLYSIGGALLFLTAAGLLRKVRAVPAIASFVAGTLAGSTPFIIYLASRGALGAFIETSFVTIPRIIDAVWSLPFPDLTSTFRNNLSLRTIAEFLIGEPIRYVLNPLVIAVALLYLLQRTMRRTLDWPDLSLMALTAFAILTQRSALGRADFPHQYFSAFLIGPMILVLMVRMARGAAPLWQRGGVNAQAFLLLAVASVFPLFFVALWVPDIINFRIDDLTGYIPRTKHFTRDPIAEEVQGRVGSVRYHVDDLSRKGTPIFDFSNQPALYFFTNRPNPTRFYQVPILSPLEFQRETILALEKAKPPIVLRRSPQGFDVFDGVDNAIRAQAVAAYIDDNYGYARSTRGVELWTRKPGARRVDVNAYLRRIRVPTLKELNAIGSRSRLIFPSAGSLAGANNSYWRSDLTLHNPFKDPLPLEIRYVAGDTRIDRRVTLAGNRTMRWEDVVKSLFQAPDSLGVIWIDYRGDRGPVARVKTYDATRMAASSIDSPLTKRDSATAGSEWDDLTIVGLPGGGAPRRRITIGLVNIGEIPATFRISAVRSDGRPIGRSIEEGLAEDESFHLPNAEEQLGVEIDENTTIEMTMIAGTCVGYASVVDVEGANHFVPAVPSPKP